MRDVKIALISNGTMRVRVYEGAVSVQDEAAEIGRTASVSRYRRTRIVGEYTVALPDGADPARVACGVLVRNLGGHEPIREQKALVDLERPL